MIEDMIKPLYFTDSYSTFDLTIENNIISVIDPRYSFYNQFLVSGYMLVCENLFVFL